jgi:hypothetical protein
MTDKLSDYGWGFQVKVLAAMFTDRVIFTANIRYYTSQNILSLMQIVGY